LCGVPTGVFAIIGDSYVPPSADDAVRASERSAINRRATTLHDENRFGFLSHDLLSG
jgi:hypothetical protein